MSVQLCYFIIYIVEAIILLQYTSALFEKKYNNSIVLLSLILTYALLYLISSIDNYLINTCAFVVVNFIFIFSMYKIRIQLALFHAAITTTVMSTSELIIFNIITHFRLDFFTKETLLFNIVILSVFSKLIYFLILYILSHFFQNGKDSNELHIKTTFLLSLVPLATIFIIITLINISTNSSSLLSMDWMLSISSLLMLGLNIFIFSFHHYVQAENQKHTEIELLLQKEYDSTEYYEMLLKQTENQKILIHDIKKHLQAISILNDNKDFDKISAYISHLINSSSLQNNYTLCEHKVLNSILVQYKQQCSDKHIDYHVDVRQHTIDFLLPNDLTSLFYNLLDNAMEAAEKTIDSFIELNILHKPNTPYTVITITNSCRKDPFEPNTRRLFTQKKDKQHHGYGLKSIHRIIQKYNGNMTMYYEKDTNSFHTIITLKP